MFRSSFASAAIATVVVALLLVPCLCTPLTRRQQGSVSGVRAAGRGTTNNNNNNNNNFTLTLSSLSTHSTLTATTSTHSSSSRFIHFSSSTLQPMRNHLHTRPQFESLLLLRPIPDQKRRRHPREKSHITTMTLSTSTMKSTSIDPSSSSSSSSSYSGFLFDPCLYHRDCQPSYLCVRADWESSCSGATNCICVKKYIQKCDGPCTICQNYPYETCTYLPDDAKDKTVAVNEGTFDGMCASMGLVEKGFLVEIGCGTGEDNKREEKEEKGEEDEEDDVDGVHVNGKNDPKFEEEENNGNGSTETTTTYTGDNNDTEPSASSSPSTSTSVTTSPSVQTTTTATNTTEVDDNSSLQQSRGTGNDNQSSDTDVNSNDNSTSSSSLSSPSSSSAACIAADMLSHLPARDLVFPKHIRAAVLCDAFGSCATPGHVVVYTGKAMTMGQYCVGLKDGCGRTVKLVNSPRMINVFSNTASHSRSIIRVESKTKHLTFTALAARFDTRVERWALKFVVERLGF